jgi:hypothetical protein
VHSIAFPKSPGEALYRGLKLKFEDRMKKTSYNLEISNNENSLVRHFELLPF